jgi:hypothetical protein
MPIPNVTPLIGVALFVIAGIVEPSGPRSVDVRAVGVLGGPQRSAGGRGAAVDALRPGGEPGFVPLELQPANRMAATPMTVAALTRR